MWKKKTFLGSILLCLVVWLGLSRGLAAAEPVPPPMEDLCIGGIGLGVSLDYVESLYGEAAVQSTAKTEFGTIKTCVYKDEDGVPVLIIKAGIGAEGRSFVKSVECRQNNLSTPRGFAVGKEFIQLSNVYGNGAAAPVTKRRELALYGEGSIYHEYTGEKPMTYLVVYEGADGRIKGLNISMAD